MRKILSLLLVLLFPSIGWATDYTQDANCQGAWLMEVDEDPLTDSSQNTYTAALKGAGEPNYLTASPPKAYSIGYYDWDGTDDYAVTGIATNCQFTGNGSIVLWVNFDATDAGENSMMVQRGTDATTWGIAFELEDNKPRFQIVHTEGGTHQHSLIGATTLNTGTWYHLAGVWDGTNLRIYVNGTEDSNSPSNVGAGTLRVNANDTITLGSLEAGGREVDGKMDEIAIFDDVLTSTEINDIKDNGLTGAVSATTIQGATLQGATIN